MSGRFEQRGISGDVTISFRFRVIRVWERPVTEFLNGGLGVLPLAPLAAVEPAQLPAIMRHLDERFGREAEPGEAEDLRATTLLLLGMRYTADQIRNLVRDMSWWRESSVYQMVAEDISEGVRLGQARRDILELGTDKFGAPDEDVVRMIEAVNDLGELRHLLHRILPASTWQELLAPDA